MSNTFKPLKSIENWQQGEVQRSLVVPFYLGKVQFKPVVRRRYSISGTLLINK